MAAEEMAGYFLQSVYDMNHDHWAVLATGGKRGVNLAVLSTARFPNKVRPSHRRILKKDTTTRE
jgi:hypothetical protein